MSNKVRRVLILLLIILKEAGPTAACSSSCSSECWCNDRGLTSVPQDLPTTITELYLFRNAITTLSQSDFSRYRSLTYIHLSDNQISMIHNNTFHNSRLTKLYLPYNRLTSLTAGMFEGLGNLQYLRLDNNQLTSLPADIFEGLGNLVYMQISDNQISSLPDGIFMGLSINLDRLLMDNNQLTSLSADILVRFVHLDELWIHNNKLTTLPADIFVGLGVLRRVDLCYNQLTSLPANLFKGLGNLQYLKLDNNQITSLPADIFVGLGKLRDLYLNNNNIHSIEAGTFNDTTQLGTLELQHNNISTITADTFGNLLQLQTLKLSHNNISTFPVKALSNLQISRLRELTLDNNQLQTLPVMAYDILASISTVNIGNNPWQCDCRMAPFKQTYYYFERQITCAGPANLQGQNLRDVNPEDLICEGMIPVYSTASTKHMVDSTLSLSPVSSSTPFHLSEMSTSKTPTLSPTQSNTLKSTTLSPTQSNTPTADSNPGWSTVSTDSPFAFQSTMTESNTGPADGGIVLSVPLLATLGAILGLLLICTVALTVGCMYKRRQRDTTPLQGFSNTNPTGTSSGHDQISMNKVTTNADSEINSQSRTPHLNRQDSQHIYNLPTDEDPDTAEYNTIDDIDQSESPHQDAGNRLSVDSFGYLNLTPSLPPKNQTGPQAAAQIESADAAARTLVSPSQTSQPGSGQIQHLDSFNDGYEVPSPSLYPGEGPQSHKYVNSQVTAAAKDAAAGPQDVVYSYEND